jgi:hypothetical protein
LTLDALEKKKPDYVLVLPWNIVEEVKRHLASDNIFKGSFVTAVPQLRIIER